MKEYTHVIITDGKGHPMAWSGEQLCYCFDTTCQDELFPVKAYTIKHAKNIIKKSQLFKEENGLSETEYRLFPFYIKQSQ